MIKNEPFKGIYKYRNVFITGNTGFKGSWLTIWLNKLNANVVGYALPPYTVPNMFDICKLSIKSECIFGDIRDYESLYKAMKKSKPEIVFHLAAQPLVRLAYREPISTYETNIMGTVNVLEAARKIDSIKAVIVVTSDKCYENKEWIYGYRENDPLGGFDPYSSSKSCCELIVAAYRNSYYNQIGKALATVRAGNVIGGGDWSDERLIPDCIKALSEAKVIKIRKPKAIRPWQYILEPLAGYLWLGANMLSDNKSFNSAWNFGPEEGNILTVEEIVNLVIKVWGGGSYEIDNPKDNFYETDLLKLDTSKAKSYLGWKPILDIQKTIYKTIEWYKHYYYNKEIDMYDYSLQQIEEYEKISKENKIPWSLT
ncbi:CDP-glucose 4,6-dehydratase [Anaerocellum danielii]|uniref:CDP-glucose 4,6-dehydratase n=1 Tax=Anaerocellum danielii TaxID=1387557 RepID=A0ABZ0TWG4_9FIRM|nr:CDP-glucose 4,6-dehydratase [Caldicellulosiruptor danielii]WPX07796.1 CDP-glucose 4,6-dehydratase [Caldicellulosiruptor danielii]